MDLGLRGRTALVTGSTSGLGLAIARVLSREHANVVITGRRAALAEQRAAELTGAIGVGLDLVEPATTAAAVTRAAGTFGAIDVLVLNAGGPPPGPAAELTGMSMAESANVLLLAQIDLVSAVLPGMRERGWGRVLAIGSSGVQQPIPGLVRSNVARAGLAAYLKTLAAEVAADGVTVNMLLPGRIDTGRVAALDADQAARRGLPAESVRARSEELIPAGRYGRPEEFADMAAFLCGDRASYTTGAQIRVDGGLISGC
ncbi:SDR family oxidoreductase [Lentzea sp. NBC_00516]|uniref:SDR family oxidoreductase n=1 Tax=Lentzea sp. NBC_00516 TaxID=2903582 RepID=UPI002E803ECB|nr:SDR family oxidoreductase [Lentzea sp. NBC_00516]WUD27469.1 SDR family oxidoreductase [Lentzea sp. NBC_00516]